MGVKYVFSKSKKVNGFVSILIVGTLLFGAMLPTIQADKLKYNTGLDKGPSYTSVVPMEKVTFVNFDEETYLDDYAYLAAVPTAVFKDQKENRLFSHPLLLYHDKIKIENDTHRTLDDYEGIRYFMEDWMSYCNGQLDQMTLINVPKSKVKQWGANEYINIDGDDPYELANAIALQDWSYSNNAIIAVIDEEFEKPEYDFSGKVEGTLQKNDVETEYFEVPQTNKLNPQYRTFDVPDGYKYVQARTWFACLEKMLVPFMWVVLPAGDKDMQLYCKYNGDWMQVAACATNTNQWGMDPEAERANSYVYNSGEWMVGITDIPTEGDSEPPEHVIKEGLLFTRHGTWSELISNLLRGVMYNVDITMYPGVDVVIPEVPPFECNDVDFELTWNNPNVKLGFSLIGPGGEEVLSVLSEEETDKLEMHLDELGQCLEGENYKICVFAMDNVQSNIDFEVEYTWGQRIDEEEGNALTSATEGAVLASTLNAPLLYVSSDKISEATSDVLYKLGVETTYLVDFGGYLSKDAKDKIDNIAPIKKHYTKIEDIFVDIKEMTGQNDIIWTTIDPWSYWFFKDEPAGEKEKALFIGPAAYTAAHHGSPVIVVDMHPRLSSAVVWHNEFWKNNADERTDYHPTVSEMYLTGTRAYDFLKDNGYDDEPLDMESMVTVADHFDVGMSWDRAFVGKAKPGRILGTPVDTTVWISRNMFYPALIFTSPALSENGVELINGSKSEKPKIFTWGGLKITRESGPEQYKYPLLYTWNCYMHRFNEMAEKYYGFTYRTADGDEPGKTITFGADARIDDGVNLPYTGEAGSFMPDITPSEIIPLYARRAGYSNAFSTSFDAVMTDLNAGVILWIRSGHGTNGKGGGTTFWNPEGHPGSNIPKIAAAYDEKNPWRGYEWLLGSTEDPDTMTMEVHGVVASLLGNPNLNGIFRTGLDWAWAKKPILDKIGKILGAIPIVKNMDIFEWIIDTNDYRDGMVQSVVFSCMGYPKYHALEYDDAMDNIHSCGIIMGDCQPAGTFLHLSLVRHGSSFQIIDPWPTSWYSSAAEQSIVRDLALGRTIGEAYVNGISKVGILYLAGGKDGGPQWWWDLMENVVYYGDPDLRVFVPGTEYSDANYWEREDTTALTYDAELNRDGHMPYGAKSYPHEKEPQLFLPTWLILVIVVIVILLLALAGISRKKK
jgi:hypothetical protein